MIQQKDAAGRNILHLQVQLDREMPFHQLLNMIERFCEPYEIKKLITERCSNERNVLMHAAAYSKDRKVMEAVLGLAKRLRRPRRNDLSTKELKAFIQSTNSHNSNSLLIASELNNKDVVAVILDFIKVELSPDERKSILRAVDGDDDGLLHLAAYNEHEGVLKLVLTHLKEVFEDADTKGLIQRRNDYGRNVLLALSIDGDVAALQAFIEMTKNVLDETELKELFISKSHSQMNCIQTAAVCNKNPTFMASLIDFAMNLFTDQESETKKLLTDADEDDKTAFQLAVAYNNKEVVRALWNASAMMLSREDRLRMLDSLGAEAAEVAMDLVPNNADDEDMLMEFVEKLFPK